MALARGRWRDRLPDDATGRAYAEIVAHHLVALPGDPRRRINGFLRDWAPWMPIADAEALMVDALTKPHQWTADTLAWRVRLIEADRAALKIRTIGAIDISKAERAKRRRTRSRKREAARRAAQGAVSRAQYLAQSATRTKPWQALGMSRRSWYRAGKPLGTSP